MAKALRRDVAPFLQTIRAFLLGREHTTTHRFEDGLSARTQHPPKIPGGPSHLLSSNSYFKRDARRQVSRPIDVVKQKSVSAGNSEDKASTKLPTPGKVHLWD